MSADERPAILYVDDEAPNLRAFALNFQDHFRVVTCSSGREALTRLRELGEVGIIICDQRMPGMTGVEVLERCRALFPDTHRMLITAYADMQVVIDAVNRGQVTRYFIKPWVKADLLAALEDAMRIYLLQIRVRTMETRLLQSERLATIGQVSAGIAHELMNPVAYMTQNVAMLRDELATLQAYLLPRLAREPDAEVSRSLEELPHLLSELEQGAQHIREVALSVKAHARGEETESTCGLLEVANFAAKMARPAVRQKVRLTVEGPPVQVAISPVKLSQVLLNLIINASQAFEGVARPGYIGVRWFEETDRVLLQVEDNGCGIPASLQQKVFEPLFTTKPAGVGTGLGLAICRELLRSAQAELSLSSEEGAGTTVSITLPRA